MRFDPYAADPASYRHFGAVAGGLASGPLDPSILQLVDVRVSQINGCAFCLAMHTPGARDAGVPQAKLDVLAGWEDAEGFTARERAALGLAEAMTRFGDGNRVPTVTWDRARDEFNDAELGALLWGIGLINLWNRVNVAVEMPDDLSRLSGSG